MYLTCYLYLASFSQSYLGPITGSTMGSKGGGKVTHISEESHTVKT